MASVFKAAIGKKGVSADHPLAVLAGIEILDRGGNAFDAAIAVSAILSVVHPFTGGPGGDGFFMAFSEGGVIAYNGSGKSPSGLVPDDFIASRPSRGPQTVTVPGLVDVWGYISENYGAMELREVLEPAIKLASSGFYADDFFAYAVRDSQKELSKYEDWVKYFGHIDKGSYVENKELADVLDTISRRGWREFYEGALSEKIVDDLRRKGVPIEYSDLEEHRGYSVRPLRKDLGELVLYEIPPNTQGIATLQMISTLYELEIFRYRFDDPRRILEWSDPVSNIYEFRDLYIGDPDSMGIESHKYVDYRSVLELLGHREANIESSQGARSDTTFFVTSDDRGNLVGFIQSLYTWFGSGIVAIGMPIQNRGRGFAYRKGLPNSPAPRKRPLHTLSVLLVEEQDSSKYVIGCASGDHRPQIHTRIFENIFIYKMGLGRAVDAPRFIYVETRRPQRVLVEKRLDSISRVSGATQNMEITVGDFYDSTGRCNLARYDFKRGYVELAPDPRSPSIAIARG